MNTHDRFSHSVVVLILLAVFLLVSPAAASAGVSVGVSVTIGPPPLPLYVQPPCPMPGYIWLPGYWAWDPAFGYYWVPGMWAPPPFYGALWTPGYWGWNNGFYVWYDGYWGPVVGFYGGINYGYGYPGSGYYGGHWKGSVFYYNRTVNNINVTNVTNYYNKPVRTVRPAGVSFNGPGGITAHPTPEQLATARERRAAPTREQEHHLNAAREHPKQRLSENHGRPAVAATARPGEFSGRGVTGAKRPGASYREPAGRTAPPREGVRAPRPGEEMHRGAAPSRGEQGPPRTEHEQRYEQPGHQKQQQQQQKRPERPAEEERGGGRGRGE